MTYETTISGESRAKVRSPGTIVLLSIVTLGLYTIYWWYEVNRELRDVGRARGADLGDNPALSAAAFFLGACLFIPYVWTVVTTMRRVEGARQLINPEIRASTAAACTLFLFALAAALPISLGSGPVVVWFLVSGALGIAAMVYLQTVLNALWQSLGQAEEPATTTGAAPGVA